VFMKRLVGMALALTAGVAIGAVARATTDNVEPPESLSQSTTYAIEDVQLQYPYLDLAVLPGEERADPTRAGVAYVARWMTDRYPGKGQCVLVLEDDSGDEVGRKEFTLNAEEPVATIDDFEPVDVSARPASGWGRCGEPAIASDTDGAGYVFGPPRVEAVKIAHGTSVWFDVTWEDMDSPPGIRICTAEVRSHVGGTETLRFGMDLGTNSETMRLLPETAAEDVAGVTIVCRPPSSN
jgi:hypothetical protein